MNFYLAFILSFVAVTLTLGAEDLLKQLEGEDLNGNEPQHSINATRSRGSGLVFDDYIIGDVKDEDEVYLGNENKLSSSQLNKAWTEFTSLFAKGYISEDEEMIRKKTFGVNFQRIVEHNQLAEQGIHDYMLGVNQFSDMSQEEFENTMLGFKVPENYNWTTPNELLLRKSQVLELSQTPPNVFDWRSVPNRINPVRAQGSCGSCWAFTAISTLETSYAIKYGVLKEFSDQHLLDCSSSYGNYGCQGGLPHKAFEFVRINGLNYLKNNPYRETYKKNRNCMSSKSYRLNKIYDASRVSEEKLKALVVKYGSISIAMDAQHLAQYRSGIFTGPCSSEKDKLNHAVNIVGYNSMGKNPYWIVRNSWSSKWGEGGYFRLPMYKNTCGLNWYKWIATY